MSLKINDEQLLEGVIGGIGWIIFSYYLRKKTNIHVIYKGFLGWMLLWYFRKICINKYKEYKIKNNKKDFYISIL